MKVLIVVLMMSVGFSNAQTEEEIVAGPAAEQAVVNAEAINVDGYVKEPKIEDPELVQLQTEIKRQKTEIVLNREKVKSYKELNKSVEKLSEATVEYLEEKKAAQAEIAAYNAKVKCMQAENPGSECDKHIRRRR